MKKLWTSLSMTAVMATPIAVVVSCGTGNEEAKNKTSDVYATAATTSGNPDLDHVFSVSGNEAGGSGSSSTFSNALQGTLAPNAHTIEKWYGKFRPDDHMKGTNEGIEITKRQVSGHPKNPGISTEDLWNWTAEASEDGLANKTAKGPDGGVKLDFQPGQSAVPKIDFLSGMPDLEYNRATIREVQPRMFGGELKPSQSTFAKVTSMNGFSNKNGDTDTGFVRGLQNQELHPIASSEYVDLDIPWNPGPHFDAKIPSGERIDALHRLGVPTVAAILFYPRSSGESERKVKIVTNPGPNHDYPVAKGMVEMAQKLGFDGWWMDWEVGSPGIAGFLKALNSYSHFGYYVTDEGRVVNIASKNNGTPLNRKPAADGSDLKDYYKNSKGQYRKLLTSNYWMKYTTFGYSDIFTCQQMHASDANSHSIQSHWDDANRNNRDRYFMNGASNAPEDKIDGCRGIIGKYYWAARAANPTDDNGNEIKQNQFSWWMWFDQFSQDINSQFETWSSYAGDPRVFDGPQTAQDYAAGRGNINNYAVSNSFREHTTVLGNKDFETSFSYGNAKGFNLWGSPNIRKSIIGTSDRGWTNWGMTDVLPTYKFIVDFYNQNGQDVTDLSVDANGKLAHRPVTPFINNETENAYFGGASLDYKGTLPVGHSMVNKLYASNIPVKANDKFKIKIRNNWANEQDRIVPDLALWTSDTQPEYKVRNEDGTLNTNAFYKSDGTEADPLDSRYKLGWHPQADETPDHGYTGRNDQISDLWRYQKDTRKGLETKERYISASNINDLGNGWSEVTYDLTNFDANKHVLKGTDDQVTTLEGKTILDFGLKMTGKVSPDNISKVSVGELKFDAAADTSTPIKSIEKLVTKKVWNNSQNKYQSARITWQTLGMDGMEYDPSKIKHYITFYKNDKGERVGIGWIGNTPAAYLTDINKAEKSQNIEIVAVDYNNDIVFQQDAVVKL